MKSSKSGLASCLILESLIRQLVAHCLSNLLVIDILLIYSPLEVLPLKSLAVISPAKVLCNSFLVGGVFGEVRERVAVVFEL